MFEYECTKIAKICLLLSFIRRKWGYKIVFFRGFINGFWRAQNLDLKLYRVNFMGILLNFSKIFQGGVNIQE